MTEKAKTYWVWTAVVVIAIVVFFGLKFNLSSFKFPVPASQQLGPIPAGEARLTVFLGNGTTRTFEGNVDKNTTVLMVLYSASLSGRLNLRYAVNKNGTTTLLSLAGVANAGAKSWNFYVNNKKIATADINRILVNTGDLIEVKLE